MPTWPESNENAANHRARACQPESPRGPSQDARRAVGPHRGPSHFLEERQTVESRDSAESEINDARIEAERDETILREHDDKAASLSKQHGDLAQQLADVRHQRAGVGLDSIFEEMRQAREGLTDAVKNLLTTRNVSTKESTGSLEI